MKKKLKKIKIKAKIRIGTCNLDGKPLTVALSKDKLSKKKYLNKKELNAYFYNF